MRVKLAARGGGRWQASGGFRSKFGLTVTEILRGLDELKTRGMQDCLKLLHFHLGSQITNIRIVKDALNEAARVYTELAKLGAGLQYIDVGGGLGVDYDGSQTNFESSMNYTLEEYANDVVYHIQSVCDEAGVPHPTIMSESGRAVVAYHSVLVFNVLGVSGFGDEKVPTTANPDWEQPLTDLIETYNNVTARNALEAYHDAQQALDMALSLFSGGYLPLEQRSMAENLFWAICTKLQQHRPDDGRGARGPAEPGRAAVGHVLLQLLALPVDPGQLGDQAAVPGDADPPAEREADEATRCSATSPATRTARWIGSSIAATSRRRCRCTRVNGEPYYLGVFLVGAYQEILGDLHNLFGDTHAVHVSLDEHGGVRLDALIKGDTVREVLDYVEFDAETLLGKLRTDVETAVREGASITRGPAAYSASTKTACTAIPTSKGRNRGSESSPETAGLEPGARSPGLEPLFQRRRQVVGGDSIFERNGTTAMRLRGDVAEVGAAGRELRQHLHLP